MVDFCPKCETLAPRGICPKCGFEFRVDISQFVRDAKLTNRVSLALLKDLTDGRDIQSILIEAEKLKLGDVFARRLIYIVEKKERIDELRHQLSERHMIESEKFIDKLQQKLSQELINANIKEIKENSRVSWLIDWKTFKYTISIIPFPTFFNFYNYPDRQRIVFLTSTDYATLYNWLKAQDRSPESQWIIIHKNSYFVVPLETDNTVNQLGFLNELELLLKSLGLVRIKDRIEEINLGSKENALAELTEILEGRSFKVFVFEASIIAAQTELDKVIYIHIAEHNEISKDEVDKSIIFKMEKIESLLDKIIEVWKDHSQAIIKERLSKKQLTLYGWHARNNDEERHNALSRAAWDLGPDHVLKILNMLNNWWKYNPIFENSLHFDEKLDAVEADCNWFASNYFPNGRTSNRLKIEQNLKREFDSIADTHLEVKEWVESSNNIDRFIIIEY